MSLEQAKQRILQRVPLASLIGESLALQQRSGRYVGLCPFHAEKSPSFTLFDDHYFCFGCRARGDAISFVREIQGLSYLEALRYLAEKFGIDAPELHQSQDDRKERLAEANLYKISAEALRYFEQKLSEPKAAFARDYLADRGFHPDFIEQHHFGLSPSDNQGLVQHLLRKGFALRDMISASVANSSQYDHRAYDFFSQRLMIPIYDLYGRVIAFGGRSFGEEQPKYKNSRETPLFDKSHVLYGLHLARETIRRERRAIVCEGYMDVLQLWQGEIPYAVACLGTALTASHLRRLGALTPLVYLIFDGDRAGRAATLRTVSLALDVPQTEFKVVVLPDQHDPDSFLKAYGKAALEDQLQKASNLLEYAIQTRLMETHDLGVPELIQKDFVPWLLAIEDPLRRRYLANRIAELTGIAARDLESSLRAHIPAKDKKQPDKPQTVASPPPPVRVIKPLKGPEKEFIAHLYFAKPGELQLDTTQKLLQTRLELDEIWFEFGLELLKALRKDLIPTDLNKAHWNSLVHPEVLRLIAELEEQAAAFAADHRQQQLEKLSTKIREISLRETLAKLKFSLHEVKPEEMNDVLSAVAQITKELHAFQKEPRS